MDLSELFVARKLADSKSVTVASSKRHSELCNIVIKTIVNDFIPNSQLLKEKASVAWNMLTSLILGISDDLLWRDAQNYLADDLTETMVMACFTCLLKANIYSESLWSKVSECFRLWCHRVRVVLVWGSVIVPLTEAVVVAIYEESAPASQQLMVGLHNAHSISMENEYLMFCWSKMTSKHFILVYCWSFMLYLELLPKLSNMSSEIFLRSAQTLEKLVDIWLRCSSVPDINTLLTLYGDFLFETCNAEKSGFDSGRAILLTSLCKILALKQHRVIAEEKCLSISYLCIQKGLASDGIVLDSLLTNIEPVLLSNQPGVRCLLPSLYDACRRVIKRYVASKPSVPESIRLCCYRLLSIIGIHFQNDLMALKGGIKMESMNGLYSQVILNASSDSPSSQILFKMCVDILVTAANVEESMSNVRFLLNTTVSLIRFDSLLVPVFAKVLEEALYLERWNIETLLTTVRCLEQFSSHKGYPLELVKRISFSLMTLAESLFSKNQLSHTYFLLIAIYEASFSWLSSMEKFDSDCVANILTSLTKFLASTEKSKKSQHESHSGSTGNNRKSLASRVFTVDGKEEELRAGTLSPNSQKSVEEMFAEYTNSMIQRALALLFDDLVRNGSLTQVDDCDEFDAKNAFTYYAFSSSIILGYTDRMIVMRNAAKRFAWKVNFTYSESLSAPSPPASPFSGLKSYFSEIHLIPKGEVTLFHRESVVDDSELAEDALLLNDDCWHGSLQDNSVHCLEILEIIDSARGNLESLMSEAPKKAIQIVPQQDYKPSLALKPFTILSHLGFLLPSIRSVLMPLPHSSELVSDLKRLDSMSFKLELSVPIEYRSDASSASSPSSSIGFSSFVNGLRANSRSYEEHSVKVDFSANCPCPDASIAVVWSENGESIDNLPNLIPVDSSVFVYLVILPVLVGDSMKGHFYQVRILLSKCAPDEAESFQKHSSVKS